MKAYLEKNGNAHLELSFFELAEICTALSAMCRGPQCANQLAVDINRRLGKMWSHWQNESLVDARPNPAPADAKPSGTPGKPRRGQRSPARDSLAKTGMLPLPDDK